MTVSAYNGVALPTFLYGTAWKKERTAALVERAIGAGFQGIDTANQLIHYSEAGVGEALGRTFAAGKRREEFFLQTKFTSVGGQDHRTPYDPSAAVATQVRQSFESSLGHLHTDYLDSYVLHGPSTRWGLSRQDWEAWAAIEELHRSGKARMIGVSNVTAEQLTLLLAEAKVRPMVVQNRCYAVTGWDFEVRKICTSHRIVYQGFSLLTANVDVLQDLHFRALAQRVRATPAQVVFRFALAVGMVPLTGTTDEAHMKEDLAAPAIELSAADVKAIEEIAL